MTLSFAPDTSLTADADGVTTALGRLGSSPDDIAAELARQGLRGIVGMCVDDPLVRYLEQIMPDLDYTDADAGTAVQVYEEQVLVRFSTGTVCIPLSPPLQEFERRFDYGQYPELVEPAEPAE